ncbi:MAG: hypothetical protein ACT4QC_05045 [Planctomycetaceae bacterium]
MLLAVELTLLGMGVYALVTGRFPPGKSAANRVVGWPARVVGLLCVLPLPMSFCVAFVVAAILVARDGALAMESFGWTAIVIEFSVLALCGVAATVVFRMNRQPVDDLAVGSASFRTCPMCGAALEPSAGRCAACGETFSAIAAASSLPESFERSRFMPRGFRSLLLIYGPSAGFGWAVFWSLSFAAAQKRSFLDVLPIGLVGGVFFGLLFGAFMAYSMRRDERALWFTDRGEFLSRLQAAIGKARYVATAQTDDCFTYKPRWGAGYGAGLCVRLLEKEARLVGPNSVLSKVVRKLGQAGRAGAAIHEAIRSAE